MQVYYRQNWPARNPGVVDGGKKTWLAAALEMSEPQFAASGNRYIPALGKRYRGDWRAFVALMDGDTRLWPPGSGRETHIFHGKYMIDGECLAKESRKRPNFVERNARRLVYLYGTQSLIPVEFRFQFSL